MNVAKAVAAARSFIRHQQALGAWTQSDLLMGLGRLYEFPPGTPDLTGRITETRIATHILAYAKEIE